MRAFGIARLQDPSNVALHAICPPTRIVASGGAGTGPERPFIVVRARLETRPFRDSPSRDGGFVVHLHDNQASYKKIDLMLKEVSAIFLNAGGFLWNGLWITAVEEIDWSEDLFDDHYGTATRFGTYKVVAGQVG